MANSCCQDILIQLEVSIDRCMEDAADTEPTKQLLNNNSTDLHRISRLLGIKSWKCRVLDRGSNLGPEVLFTRLGPS